MPLETRLYVAADAGTNAAYQAAQAEWTSRVLVEHPAADVVHATLPRAISPRPDENVVGVGIGEKFVSGRPTGIRSIKFFVRRKYPQTELSRRNRLPREADGIPIDVEETGAFRAHFGDPRSRHRPAPAGTSLSFALPGNLFQVSGTLGALVEDAGGQYVLSNNHILADLGRLAPGTAITQPAAQDGGRPNADRIASLDRFVPIVSGAANLVDCAVARIENPADVTNTILGIGPIQGPGTAALDTVVHKMGRATGYTAGVVRSVNTNLIVEFGLQSFTFHNQIIIRGLNQSAFSLVGDSGALVVERSTQVAVGLLFAGSSDYSVANHIGDVLNSLGVSLV